MELNNSLQSSPQIGKCPWFRCQNKKKSILGAKLILNTNATDEDQLDSRVHITWPVYDLIARQIQPRSQTQHVQDPFPPSDSLISYSISFMALTTYAITQAKNLNSFQMSLKSLSNLSALVQASSFLSKTTAAVSYLPISKTLSSLQIFIFLLLLK